MSMPSSVPLVSEEEARLRALKRCRILDTPPEPTFDSLTRLAQTLLKVPAALLSFFDGEREWTKSQAGLEVPVPGRGQSFCAYVIQSDSAFIVPDAQADIRFANNALVARPAGIRFYAGVPVKSPEGCRLGAFAILDTASREDFGEAEREALSELAAIASDLIHARTTALERSDWVESDRVHRQLTARIRQQAAVSRLGHRALSQTDLSQVMDEACSIIAETLQVEYCKILELLPERKGMLLRAGIGWKEGLIGSVIVPADLDSQAGYTLFSSGPVIVDDLGKEKRFSGPSLLFDHDVMSGLSVIIHGRGRPWGVLEVHTVEQRTFTPEDAYFVQSVANILSAAIDRKHSEEALRVSEERFRSLSACSPAGIFTTDLEGRWTYVNPRCQEMVGFTTEECMGQGWMRAVHPEDAGWLKEEWSAAVAGNRSYEQHFRFGAGERQHWVHLRTAPMWSSGQQAIGFVGTIEDVTESRRAEEALRHSEATVRALFESAPQGIIAVDTDGRFRMVNARTAEMFGYEQAELLGQEMEMLLPERMRKFHFEHRADYFVSPRKRPMGQGLELIGRKKDGSEFPVDIGLSYFEAENEVLAVAFISDITERKRAEEQILFQASILEQVQNAVIATDAQGRVKYWNKFAESMYGWKADQVLGKRVDSLTVPKSGRREIWRVLSSLQNTGRWEGELVVQRRDATTFPAFITYSVIKNSVGRVIGMISVSIDISERKRSEEALRHANRNLQAALQASPLATITTDQEGKVQLWNQAAERLFGWQEDEVLGRPGPNIPSENASELLIQLHKTGKSFAGVEERRVRKDGSFVDVSIWATPLRDETGKIAGSLAVFVDITDRKQLDEQFGQLQTLEAVCQIIEAQSPGLRCSILLVDDSGQRLLHAAAPSLPDSFLREIEGIRIWPGAGSCGTAAFNRAPVIVSDIEGDPLWSGYRGPALAHGLRACWAVPILSRDGTLLGTLAAYHHEPREPSRRDLELLDRSAGLAALIIERRRVEQALWESEERYRRLFENNPLPMWVFGLDTLSFLAVNEAAIEHYGFTREEFGLMTVKDLLAPEDVPRLYDTILKSAEYVDLSGRWKHRKKDSTRIDVETTAFTLAFGERRAALLQANDITRRKQAEEALRESEEKYRTLFEESRDAIVISNREGANVDANHAALELFGYTPEEKPRLEARDIYVDASERLRFQRELEQSGSVREFEVRLRKKDGAVMNCLVAATVRRGKDGSIKGYQKIIRDITARKEAERSIIELSGRLLQLQDEERRRIARELHDSTAQNLNALAMNISLLKLELSGLDVRQEKLLSEAHALAGQSTRELRTISHLLHPPLLDEMGLVSALRSFAEGFSRRSGIETRLELVDIPRLPREVETALFRIVQESLTNIHKHSGSREARIGLALERGEVCVEVQDYGRGISSGVRGKDWETTARSLGVGIAGMRERVRQLGGRLEIVSGEGGTTIRTILPFRHSQHAA